MTESITDIYEFGDRALDGIWLENHAGIDQALLTIEWRVTMCKYRIRGLILAVTKSGSPTLIRNVA